MFAWFNSKTQPMVGLDISSTSVKLIELSRAGERYRVESYAVKPLPPEAMAEKVIQDSEAVSQTVKDVVAQSKTAAKSVAIAVADSSVITKLVQIEAGLSEDEIESQIALEADKYIPYPLEEVSLDFQVLGPSAKSEELSDVLLVASRSENVDSRLGVVEGGGLNAEVVDVESYAMERACSLIADQLPSKGIGEIIAVVDIGSTVTNLTVLYNLSTIFTREEIFGGKQLTVDIQRHYGLTFAEAGLAKKQGNLPDDYAAEVLGPFKESAVLQVRRSLQFFFSASQHSEVSHIVLAGGASAIPGLAALIEEQMGVPTTTANPFSNMMVAKGINAAALAQDAPALMISCGLAMRSFDE